MPASETAQEHRGGRLLTVLFWSGVGLAPLAALTLLLGQSEGPVRIAAVLCVLAVVLIGLSITLRRDVDTVRLELEDTLLDEVDLLREDIRQDIATAARSTHRQFSEKLQYLHESVEALRAQVEAMRLGYDRPEPRPVGAPSQHVGAAHGGVPPGGPLHVGPPHPGQAPGAGMAPPVVGGGVVRHTETVQVTTRHTVVDPHAEGQGGRGTVYGAGAMYGGVGGEPAPNSRRDSRSAESWGEPAEESWTEQRLRERLIAARAGDDRGESRSESRPAARADSWSEHRGDVRRPRPYDRGDDDDVDDDRWSGIRAGDRWTSMRTDDHGRELRMGERRAAMHTDESGTELRIEDRWAAVRRDERRGRREETTARRSDERRPDERRPDERRPDERRPDERRPDERWEDDRRSDDRWEDDRRDARWVRRGGQAALPAASSEPSWDDEQQSRSQPESARAGRRGRYRDSDDGYSREAELEEEPPPVRPRPRRVDFELSDDRWR